MPKNRDLRSALERSVVAIDDWLNSYAAELCDPKRVEEARRRIGEYGVLAYIASVQEQNRAALKRSSRSPEYRAWNNAKHRCYNVNNARYPRYGGRGIEVCERWRNSFQNFIADMGPRPSPHHSLERIDNEGPYAPENCQWATSTEQNNNRCFNRHVVVDGERLTVAQAAKLTGVKHATICSRLERGKSDDEAIQG